MTDNSTIEVIGMERIAATLDPARWDRFPLALQQGGIAMAAEMQRAAKSHHDRGTLERAIHSEGPIGRGLKAEVRVGISTSAAPEGRPLAFGWKSDSGKMPPIAPIADWLTRHPEAAAGAKGDLNRKGGDLVFRTMDGKVARQGTVAMVSSQSQIRSRAFLIARAIQRRGYSFGRSDWFHDGIRAGRPRLDAIVRKALSWGLPK